MNLHSLRQQTIVFLFMLFPLFNLHGQWENIRFNHLSIEQGMSQSSAYGIVQDSKGFIWICTEAGLNRYEGYTFKVYEHDENNPNSISNSYILSICKDKAGVIWIGTEVGLNRFDVSKEQFTRYFHNPDDPHSLSNNRILSICEDRYGFIWIGTECGLNKFSKRKKHFTRYNNYPDNPNSLSHNQVRAVYVDKSGVLWIGTYGGGLNEFDRKKDRFNSYKNIPDDPFSLSDNRVLSIHEDNSGVLWIGTDGGGLNKFDRENGVFIHYKHEPDDPNSLSENNVNCIYEDDFGFLWIGTNNGGLNLFDRGKMKFISFKNEHDKPHSISFNRIVSIFEDNNEGLWFGTRGGGINIFYRETQKFVHYKSLANDPNSLSYNAVRPIYEDSSGILWIGTDGGGFNKFDRKKDRFTHYKHDPDNPKSISSNRVIAICEDKSGVFWLGTNGGGLNKFSGEWGAFTRYKHDPNNSQSLCDDRIRAMKIDTSGVLWIGTNGGGLDKFDREKEEFTHYKHDPNDPHSLSNDRIFCVYIDRSNVLWIGTFGGGLNKFDREKEQFIHYQTDTSDITSISNNFIVSICEDHKGIMWIGTVHGGLNKFDRSKGKFKRYTTKDGLPDDLIYDILEDSNGYLWMSTNRGLSRFDPETEEFKNFDVKDGLQSNEFNTGTGFVSKSGEMFFGGINGFNSFYPDSIMDNPFVPPVVITSFQIFNKPVPVGKLSDGRTILEKSITETKEITLSYTDNVFSFEFAALHYISPERNQYAYKMRGLEKEWNYVGNRRFVTYTGLPPGEYTFRVMGSNNDGVWNERGTSLQITIIPPYWQTWWFYVLCIVSIVLIIVAIFIYQLNRLRKQREEEEHRRVTEIFSQVLEQGDAAVYRRKFNSDKYDYMGEGVKDITGYEPGEFSKSLWDKIVIETESGKESDGLYFSMEDIFEQVQEGKLDRWLTDVKITAKSGEIKWIRDMMTALRDERGHCYGCFGIIFDITDRKLAEQELAEKGKSIQRTLFEHTPDPIFLFDKETHKFLDCNQAALRVYGYSIDEFRVRTPFDLHPRADRRKVDKNIDIRNVDVPNEYKHLTKDGRKIDVEILSDETVYLGRQAWISIVRNITERKQVEKKLALLSEELKMQNKEMEKDLDMARDVQMALLSQHYPKNFPKNVPPEQSALQFSHRYIPASTLAGDFFEIFPISDHQVGVMIYDVMGHGVRASLLTAYLHGLVEKLMPSAADPVIFIEGLNEGLNAIMEQFLSGMFATAFYVVVDIKKGMMYFTNAGHPKPYIIRRSTGTVEKMGAGEKHVEPALGLFNRFNYTASECSMNNDDIILFFTDGVYEVEGTSNEMFGEKQLMATVRNKLNTSPEQMLDEILQEINTFSGTDEFRDDVCLVSMHIRQI